MNETVITQAEALRGLRFAVEGNEDRTTWAKYMDGAQPVCLIANALACLGVPAWVLAQLDTVSQSMEIDNKAALQILQEKAGFVFTPGAVALLGAAQRWADRRQTWEGALLHAVERTGADVAGQEHHNPTVGV